MAVIHVTYSGVYGSGLTMINQLTKNPYFVDFTDSFAIITNHSVPGDKIVFHGRKSIINSMIFLLYNKLVKRNKIIYNPHTNLRAIPLNKFVLNTFVDRIISFTEYNKKQLIGFNNVIVIPNPLPMERLMDAKNLIGTTKEVDFVWAGRNVPLKRMEIFIKAIDKVKEVNGIILADRFEDKQKELIANVGKRLVFKEGTNKFEFFYELMKGKVFVFTSTDAEGFPIILLEAIYLGLPILAPDNAKYREILKDEAIYWKDEQDLQNIMKDIHSGKLQVKPASKLIEIYKPERIIEQYEAIK